MKLAIVSLGCPKNQVDADVFCRALIDAGHRTVPSTAEADLIIINTCGFIESAKAEAIQAILEACALKRQNPALKVLVSGCLAERYQSQVAAEIPEVDAVVGLGGNAGLPAIVEKLALQGGQSAQKTLQVYGPKTGMDISAKRVISTPAHYAWLKIAEGCSNRCSYCAIPSIRGPLRSRPMEGIVAEARWLARQGVRELVLVAQDVTAYGDDAGQNQIVPLLHTLDSLKDAPPWIRLLYAYPERVTDELLAFMAQSKRVLPYLDLPVQHCSEGVLRAMGRKGGAKAVYSAVTRIRAALPAATLRTTLITGFPGESEAQFEELCAFVQQTRFDRLGCFAYSPEEDTPAEKLPGQLPAKERERRADVIMRLQAEILAQKQQALVGEELTVLCDGYDPDEGLWRCRGAADAPEIDTEVLLHPAKGLRPGSFWRVRVTAADGCDLLAEPLGQANPRAQ